MAEKEPKRYRVLKPLRWAGGHRAAQGAIRSDIPEQSISWLTKRGYIELYKEARVAAPKPKKAADTPKPKKTVEKPAAELEPNPTIIIEQMEDITEMVKDGEITAVVKGEEVSDADTDEG